jgi:hypothetical protein
MRNQSFSDTGRPKPVPNPSRLSQASQAPLEKGLWDDPYCQFPSGLRKSASAVQIRCTPPNTAPMRRSAVLTGAYLDARLVRLRHGCQRRRTPPLRRRRGLFTGGLAPLGVALGCLELRTQPHHLALGRVVLRLDKPRRASFELGFGTPPAPKADPRQQQDWLGKCPQGG